MNDDTTHLLPESALAELPVFPLPEAVLFPGAVMPLHIFEPRYRAMLRDALSSHKLIVLATIPDLSVVGEDGQPRFANIAGVGLVTEHHRMTDGRSNLLLRGVARLQVSEIPSTRPYRRVQGKVLRDVPSSVSEAERIALLAEATAFAGEVAKRDDTFRLSLPQGLSPGELADLCAHNVVADARIRQLVLETLDVRERVREVTAAVAIQHHQLRKASPSALN
jgi:ATP-dependent Lon protease